MPHPSGGGSGTDHLPVSVRQATEEQSPSRASRVKSDFNYTSSTVFDTFPWPQNPTAKQIESVAEAGVRRLRAEALKKMKGGLRALYRTVELPGMNPLKDVHAALDQAVMAAYGFSAKKDLRGQLLVLNLEVAERMERK